MNYADPDRRKGFKLGGSTYIDQLTYGYQNTNASNKLSAIVNAANDTTAKLGDFQYNPATKQTTDYTYDGNGNQLTDNNRKIDGITYNFLNLAQQIHVIGKGNIKNFYLPNLSLNTATMAFPLFTSAVIFSSLKSCSSVNSFRCCSNACQRSFTFLSVDFATRPFKRRIFS